MIKMIEIITYVIMFILVVKIIILITVNVKWLKWYIKEYTYIIIDFGRSHTTKDVRNFDYNSIHVDIKLIKTLFHRINTLAHITKENPDCTHIFNLFMDAWNKDTLQCLTMMEIYETSFKNL